MVFGASNLLMVRPLTMKLATLMYHDESSLTLGAHAQRGTVVGFVCLSVCLCVSVTLNLTSRVFVHLTKDTPYLTGNEGQKF